MSASEALRSAFGATLLLAGIASALAQTPPAVTEANIERARRSQPTITDADIERARRTQGPRVDALPQPATRTPMDLSAIAQGFDAQRAAMPQRSDEPRLLIFISLGMPDVALGRLVDQAARAQATLVLRGFLNGSLRQTIERMQALIGDRKVAVQIDPQAFDRYAVARTPSFVLVAAGSQAQSCSAASCVPPDQYVATAGDVTLDYALRHMQRSAPARFGRDAAPFLSRLSSGKGAGR